MIRLGILFGGRSYEHEISIITAYQLKKKLEKEYELHFIYVSLNGDFYNADRMELNDFKVENKTKLKKLNLKKLNLAAVVIAMHGENGEDGLGAAFAKLNHLKYVGCDLLAASICMDKYKSYLYLNSNGIPMVNTLRYTYQDYLSGQMLEEFPCIVKPVKGGSSLGIVVIKKPEDCQKLLKTAFEYSHELVVQPYYEELEEYNLALSEDEISILEKIHKKDDIFSFENKYSDSFKLMHQGLVEQEDYEAFTDIGRRVYDFLGAHGIIRIDFFKINNQIYVNEVNTTPGALAMYLFPDFNQVFKKTLDRVLRTEEKSYPNSHFLIKNNITK